MCFVFFISSSCWASSFSREEKVSVKTLLLYTSVALGEVQSRNSLDVSVPMVAFIYIYTCIYRIYIYIPVYIPYINFHQVWWKKKYFKSIQTYYNVITTGCTGLIKNACDSLCTHSAQNKGYSNEYKKKNKNPKCKVNPIFGSIIPSFNNFDQIVLHDSA